jgi:hypothetical protein
MSIMLMDGLIFIQNDEVDVINIWIMGLILFLKACSKNGNEN